MKWRMDGGSDSGGGGGEDHGHGRITNGQAGRGGLTSTAASCI